MIPIIIIIALSIFILITKQQYLASIITLIALVTFIFNHYNISHPNQLSYLFEKMKEDYLKFDPIHQIVSNNEMESFINNPKPDLKEIPTGDIYAEFPELIAYQKLRDKIFSFLDTINDEGLVQGINNNSQPERKQNDFKMKIDKAIAFIFYRCYLITTDNYYPQNNYSACLKHQKDLLNVLDNCIFLSLTDEQDVYLGDLIKELKEINKKINTIMIEKVNTKMNVDDGKGVTSLMGFLPEIDDPEPIDLTDDHFRHGQFTNW